MTLRVLLADDHELVRGALARLLGERPETEVVGEASDGLAAVALARELRPDVVLMDLGLPQIDGIEATRRIVDELPEVQVVLLTAHGDVHHVRQALEAGALGYLRKTAGWEHLDAALAAAAERRVYLDPVVAEALAAEPEAPLTDREREVVGLVAEGLANKQIAARLGLSTKTVEYHRARIMAKLQLSSTAELVLYAARTGLLGLDGAPPQG